MSIVLIILGAIGYYLVSSYSNSSSKIDIRDRQFAIKNPTDIYKIFISQRNGRKILLEKKESNWMVQDSYIVHPNVIGNMLDLLGGLRMKYIPPRSANENIMKAFANIGINVKLYDQENNLLKAYQVGGTTAGELGTVFLMDGFNQPYVMELPNFEGSLRGRFLFDNIDQLRDRTVFAYAENNIKNVTINYPKDKLSSFKLSIDPKNYQIFPLDKGRNIDSKTIKKGAVERFLRSFQDLDAEAFENFHVLKDSIKSLIPIAEISVEDTNGFIKEIKLFPLLDVFNPEINTRSVNIDPRVERYFVDCSWGDFMLSQQLLFGKILWKYDEFFEN